MDALTLFGLVAVSLMLVCYALEPRSRWFALGFAGACALGSIYGFLQGAWPFGIVEAIWSAVALRRWVGTGKPGPVDQRDAEHAGLGRVPATQQVARRTSAPAEWMPEHPPGHTDPGRAAP